MRTEILALLEDGPKRVLQLGTWLDRLNSAVKAELSEMAKAGLVHRKGDNAWALGPAPLSGTAVERSVKRVSDQTLLDVVARHQPVTCKTVATAVQLHYTTCMDRLYQLVAHGQLVVVKRQGKRYYSLPGAAVTLPNDALTALTIPASLAHEGAPKKTRARGLNADRIPGTLAQAEAMAAFCRQQLAQSASPQRLASARSMLQNLQPYLEKFRAEPVDKPQRSPLEIPIETRFRPTAEDDRRASARLDRELGIQESSAGTRLCLHCFNRFMPDEDLDFCSVEHRRLGPGWSPAHRTVVDEGVEFESVSIGGAPVTQWPEEIRGGSSLSADATVRRPRHRG